MEELADVVKRKHWGKGLAAAVGRKQWGLADAVVRQPWGRGLVAAMSYLGLSRAGGTRRQELRACDRSCRQLQAWVKSTCGRRCTL